MNRGEATGRAVAYWLEKARECLEAARDEQRAGRLAFAVNRAYFAAFYAASAVLLSRGHRFAKHSGVRAVLHRQLVKTGLLEERWGRLYDRLFEERQHGDYVEFVSFDGKDVATVVEQAAALVAELSRLPAPVVEG